MRQHFLADWAFGITGAIQKVVRQNFPQDLRSWPLIQAFNADAYVLPTKHVAIIFKDKLSGIPTIGDVKDSFPYSGFPVLPPKVEDIELWQFYFRTKFSLQPEDAAFLIPIKDSGINDVSKDFELFSTEEKLFWSKQISHVISQYKSHLQNMTIQPPVQPTTINYNLSGMGARVNINSKDSSINVISAEVSKVFSQVRDLVKQISDESARTNIERAIDELEESHGTDGFMQKYQAFISSAANHMTVLSPIIPALTNLLA